MIKAIIATDSEGGIGKNGTIPWPPNKEDLKHYQRQMYQQNINSYRDNKLLKYYNI